MNTVLTIFGTRPEAVKLCPLCRELSSREAVRNIVVLSGQHTEMTDRVLESFFVRADYRLPPPPLRAPLSERTAELMRRIEEIVPRLHPDGVIVHGDTATALAASMVAFLRDIPIFHVEAGLRSGNLHAPFPEEYNRRCISLMSALDFAPTVEARDNLLREGKPRERICVTGNTVVDALRYTVSEDFDRPILRLAEGKRLVLLTVHRRENLGEPMYRIFSAVKRLARTHPDVCIICPLHPNPTIRRIAYEIFPEKENTEIFLTEPLDVVTFHNLLARSALVMTDSGGLQEEAPSIGVPVLLLRETTERPEGIREGLVHMVGSDEERIIRAAEEALTASCLQRGIRDLRGIYGDGYASQRICDRVEEYFRKNSRECGRIG